jgi:hypothetical protein
MLLLCACVVVAALVAPATFSLRRGITSEFGVPRITMPGMDVEVTRTQEESFAVDTPLVLELNNAVGSIDIRGTDGSQVTVEATVRAWGGSDQEADERANRVQVDMQQTADNRVQVTSTIPQELRVGRSPSVNITVRVPRQSRVQVVNNVGEVTIRDIEGSLDVQVNVGEVDVRGFSILDDSTLRTDVGQLHIGLPSDSSFNLDARTSVGAIRSDFDLAQQEEQRPGVGARLQGPVGDSPQVGLTLQANTGEIRLIAE